MNREERALINWVQQFNWTVFGTLKFTDGTRVGREQGENIVRKFWHKLDRMHYGQNMVGRGAGIQRFVSLQFGESRANRHYHFVASPPHPKLFCTAANKVWGEMTSWCDATHSWIQIAESSNDTSSYVMHEVRFDKWRDEKSFCPQHTFINTLDIDLARFNKFAQNNLNQYIGKFTTDS